MGLTAALAAFLAALLAPPAVAQLPEDPRLQDAFLAWDRGDYPAALEGYLAVLDGADGADHVAEIAALTGEVFEVTELTDDGDDIVVDPSGRWVAYHAPDRSEEGGDGEVHVVDLTAGAQVVATLPGGSAVLSAAGTVAYTVLEETPELAEARLAMDQADDRAAFVRARAALSRAEGKARTLRIRDLASGDDRAVDLGGWLFDEMAFADEGGALYLVAGRADEPARNDLLRVATTGPGATASEVTVLSTGDGFKEDPRPVRGGELVVYEVPDQRPIPADPSMAGAGQVGDMRTGLGVVETATGRTAFVEGAESVAISADGSRIAWQTDEDDINRLYAAPLTIDALSDHAGPALLETEWDLDNPALSPDGRWLAYQKRPIHDWEIYAQPADGSGPEIKVTWEIQHDLFPAFVDGNRLIAAKGEGRHRRAFMYALEEAAEPVRLHQNNLVRTIAPEYEWAVAPAANAVVIQAERDGDTVSPERGVYVVHLDRPVTREAVRERLLRQWAAERELRALGERLFRPIEARVRPVTEAVDVGRIYQHAKVLHSYGSKYVTEPGNQRAMEYLAATLRTYGYEPELQWFDARGNRSANVIVRIPGTVSPELVYVVSSHFDSTQRGPGADDNTSATTALLEVARVMKDHPQPATVELAFFTGEEAGLLGSREYVRRAVAEGKQIVGALNNDMVGWANDHRLDNTIRYSNPGIRDIQHNAAMLFSELITYDALYYKSTDAAAYYEAYGDIVGGIGSYPVLGNPHYHQFTDRLVTIDQRLVAEVGRTTAATIMLIASSPARLSDVTATPEGEGAVVRWAAAPEHHASRYLVRWTTRDGEERTMEITAAGVEASVTLPSVRPGSEVAVKAVNDDGMVGWDWARAVVAG